MYSVTMSTTAGTIATVNIVCGPTMDENRAIALASAQLTEGTMVRVIAATYTA